jgi:hypothetical protein
MSMDNIPSDDKNLIKTLGLEDAPELAQKAILEEIDTKTTKLFLASVLASLTGEQAQELEAEVADIPSENTQAIIEKIITKHPQSDRLLKEAAEKVFEEIKKNMPQQPKEEGDQGIAGATEIQADTPRTELGTEQPAPEVTNAPELMSEPAVEPIKPEERAELAGPNEPSVPVASEDNKPLPVPQQESAQPFGDEIELVRDEEPPAPAPAETTIGEPANPSTEIPSAPTEPAPIEEANPFVEQPPAPGEISTPEAQAEPISAVPEEPPVEAPQAPQTADMGSPDYLGSQVQETTLPQEDQAPMQAQTSQAPQVEPEPEIPSATPGPMAGLPTPPPAQPEASPPSMPVPPAPPSPPAAPPQV